MLTSYTEDVLPKKTIRRRETSWRDRLLQEQEQHWQKIRERGDQIRFHLSARATYVHEDAIRWLAELPPCSIHAIVTDPPYGLIEYEEKQLIKRKKGSGGVWRIPPSFDGVKRAPLPRFTVLSAEDLAHLHGFFSAVAYGALRALVPGGHVFIASNPLLSTMCFHAFQEAGFEKRGHCWFHWSRVGAELSDDPGQLRTNLATIPIG